MTAASILARVGPLARTFGVVPLVMALFVGAAAAVQLTSSLPNLYAWWTPVELVGHLARRAHVPTELVVGFAFGSACRALPLRATSFDWFRHLGRRRRLRGVLGAAFFVVVPPSTIANGWLPHDIVALAIIGWWLGTREPSWAKLKRVTVESVISLSLFVGVSYGYSITKALVFSSVPPMDQALAELDRNLFGTDAYVVAARWALAHPEVITFCEQIYFRLFEHMAVGAVFLAGLGRADERNRYLASLATCYFLGAISYYLLPSLGPAFHDPDVFAYLRELAPAASALQELMLDNYRAVQSGSLEEVVPWTFAAAMPSLHVAHELLMLWYARHSRPFFALSTLFTIGTIAATSLLGWHYAVDWLGGALLTALSFLIVRHLGRLAFPDRLWPSDTPA
ncbi:MAG: phosphatase PAP2 family protein [Myxococcota bacterium]